MFFFFGFLFILVLLKKVGDVFWLVWYFFIEEWIVKFVMYGLVFVKFNIKFNDLFGFMVLIFFVVVYYYFGWNILFNIMSVGMCYVMFMFLLLILFGIGIMVLWGFFVYDIVMVFYM